jgi:hypothetical protein
MAQPAPSDLESKDLKITTRHSSGASSYEITEYLSGENSRSEMQLFSGSMLGHHRALIRKKEVDKIRVYDLDLDAHEYVSYQTDLRGIRLNAKPIPVTPSGKTLVVNIETVDTGEQQEMFGHVARHMITKETRISKPGNCYNGSSIETDGWYIDSDLLPPQKRPKAGVATLPAFRVGKPGNPRCSDKIEVHRTGPQTGFPLKLKTTFLQQAALPDKTWTSSVPTTEVIEFVEAPLPPELFEVPSGFKKVDRIIDPTQQPARLQAMTYWQRFKQELRNWFQ